MKRKGLFIATIIFFLLVNTTYFWEGKMGMFIITIFLLMIVYFIALSILLLRQTFCAVKEKFRDSERIVLVGVMFIILTTSFVYPRGLINFEKIESDSLLVAQIEGAANCMTTLKLRANNTFIERNVCFGITEVTGEYRILGDTIYFDNTSPGRYENELYEFAVIKAENKKEKYLGTLVRYESLTDTTGTPLLIIKNVLKK